MEIKTLNDLKMFFESIPEDQWITELLEDDKGRRCALGHLNYHLSGNYTFTPKCMNLLKSLGINRSMLIDRNNGALIKGGTPKSRTLDYLNSFQDAS